MAREVEVSRKREKYVADDADDDLPAAKRGAAKNKRRNCPYLDTINRQVLDFDFEKLCSVSLSRINVYACLVCGKYFQGRGQNTHAYTHSVEVGHHVFLNLQTLKFYCLPDNYEVIDSSLDDIKYVLKPTFTQEHINKLNHNDKLSRAIDGTTYLPGIVGLNNIKANDYCNVILQALSHVPPLRNYFLREENYSRIKRPPGDSMFLLVQRFGELMRKLWNPRNFKAHVSPHEMLQAVVLCSKKKFQITEQGDPILYLSWFLNALHLALGGTSKKDSSIIYKVFRGKMRIFSRKIPPVEMDEQQKQVVILTEDYQEKMEVSPFLYLTVDLPPPPLFKDEFRENIIPQVPLFNILAKFNGYSEKEYKTYKDSTMKRFEITQLPPYLILYIKLSYRLGISNCYNYSLNQLDGKLNVHLMKKPCFDTVNVSISLQTLQRFTKNTFFIEKNPTIVNFPIKNIDLGDILSAETKLKHPNAIYDLLANVVHDGEPAAGKGTYRVHIFHKGSGKWFELQDLHVTEILPQMITLSEAYIQIYELRKPKARAAKQKSAQKQDVARNPGVQK